MEGLSETDIQDVIFASEIAQRRPKSFAQLGHKYANRLKRQAEHCIEQWMTHDVPGRAWNTLFLFKSEVTTKFGLKKQRLNEQLETSSQHTVPADICGEKNFFT